MSKIIMPPWTASSLNSYTTCPYKWFKERVTKEFTMPRGEAALWGERVHKALENAVNTGDDLPETYAKFKPLVAKVRSLPGEHLAEHKFAIDENFAPAPWRSSWSRGIADLVVKQGDSCVILDYKTGKRKPSDQLMLYAGYAFVHFPEVKRVHTGFIWLKEHKTDRAAYTRDQLPDIWGEFLPAVARMKKSFETGDFPKRPNGLCRAWCPVKNCKFCGV